MCVSSAVCSVRVIGESDIMQEFLSESDEVEKIKINMFFARSPPVTHYAGFGVCLT